MQFGLPNMMGNQLLFATVILDMPSGCAVCQVNFSPFRILLQSTLQCFTAIVLLGKPGGARPSKRPLQVCDDDDSFCHSRCAMLCSPSPAPTAAFRPAPTPSTRRTPPTS